MSTKDIWTSRYLSGGNSGSGSYNELYLFKRDVINQLITDYQIESMIDFGCGDGNQIKEFNIKDYIGLDIASSSIKICKEKYQHDSHKKFYVYDDPSIQSLQLQADLTISLDVLYHILEDDIFMDYLKKLFTSSSKYVLIYSNNYNGHIEGHMHTRKFTDYVENFFPNWSLAKKIDQKYPQKSSADFYFYCKKET